VKFEILSTLCCVTFLSGCAVVLSGCHTIDAVHRIARPSPVSVVSVEPNAEGVSWIAEYREPPRGSDPILHGIFVRGVAKRGLLDFDPASTCVVSLDGDDALAEPLSGPRLLLDFRSYPPIREAAEAPEQSDCERQLELRLAGSARYPKALAIEVEGRSPDSRFEFAFPVERPVRDPRRWGWLVAAPLLDAGTLALSVPIAGLAVVFESLIVALGPIQIQDIGLPVLVITTTSKNGRTNDRALGYADSDGHRYVAANHWPRAWYNRALKNPEVQITLDGETRDYLAVPVSGDELDRIRAVYRMPTVVRFLTAFPPRAFLRLDPR
jgi:hypothetical protein